eukprot:TRINITY_DN11554_c0_g1_i1.p1 TRINITY_DN11554_c0_g1~~TRINITY_DN11554_c0_g1_i1.p1  ORF type:complete len:437 (+),score=100.29 TRINITY_DN11554_c0_g1_i1:52-1311(+)
MVKSALRRRAFVLGGDITKFMGKGHADFVKGKITIEDYIRQAVTGALTKTGVSGKDVDRVCIGNFCGQLYSRQGHLGAAVVGCDDGLIGKPAQRFEAACASGGMAFENAVQSIAGGNDIVLVVGVEVQTTASSRDNGDYLATAADYRRQRPIDDFVWPALFAEKAAAYFQKYPEANRDDLNLLTAKAYHNASLNPLAHMHDAGKTTTLEDIKASKNFLGNEKLSRHIKLSDCSQVSDGAAAIVVVSEDGLRKLSRSLGECIEVMGVVQSTDNLFDSGDPTELTNIKRAASKLYEATASSPKDLSIVELHDCFTMAEVMMYEALQLAPPGKGLELLKSGKTSLKGDLPVNTGGGLVGFGHPVGATGVKQIIEIYRQFKGQCGEYQIKHKNLEYGLTANMGGDDKTAVVSLFKNISLKSSL